MNAEALGINPGGELVSRTSLATRGRQSNSFSPGLRDRASVGMQAGAVESLPAMAKAATQPGSRGGKLTQAQLEARAQQRIEDDELIREALDKLTPRERTVFELKHYQGLKLRAIGDALGTTEETVKNSLFRATRKLRSQLGELL